MTLDNIIDKLLELSKEHTDFAARVDLELTNGKETLCLDFGYESFPKYTKVRASDDNVYAHTIPR